MPNTTYGKYWVFNTYTFKVLIIYSYHLTPLFFTFKRLWKTDTKKISIKSEVIQSFQLILIIKV